MTTLGIIIGIAALVLIVSLGKSAQSSIAYQIQKLGINLIGVLPGKAEKGKPPLQLFSSSELTSLKYEDAKAIKKLPGVAGVCAFVRGSAEVSYLNETKNILFSGVDPSYTLVESVYPEKGRFFTERENESMERVAVLGNELADDLFGNSDPIGKKIKINGLSFKVIGIMPKRGKILFFDLDNHLFLPIRTAQKEILGINYISLIRAKAESESKIPEVASLIEKTLRYRHQIKDVKKEDFTVRSASEMLDVFNKIINALKIFLALIAGVSLIVGGIGISSVMYVIVDERIREIGLRKAVGARNSDILWQFLVESMALTLIGGIIGILLGILGELLISLVTGRFDLIWPFEISLPAVFIGFVVSIFIGFVFGFMPAKKASRLSPSEAMRYE